MAQWQLPPGAKVVGDSVSRARRATPPRGVGLLSLAELPLPSSHERVLGTSARKPPLSDTLLWVTLSLAHPFEIEVILSKRVEVLPKQRGREKPHLC